MTSTRKTRILPLIGLLENFNSKEMSRFTKLVTSPYFNSDPKIVELLTFLKEYILHVKAFDDIAQASIYKSLFESSNAIRTLDKSQKKNLFAKMSILGKLTQKFLVLESLENNSACEFELLSKQLIDRHQFHLFNSLVNKHKKSIVNEKKKELNHYNLLFQIEHSQIFYLHQLGLLEKENNFRELIDSINMRFILYNLKVQLTIQSLISVTKKPIDNLPKQILYSQLLTSEYSQHPLILLYSTVIELLKTYNEETYFKLLKLLDQHGAVVSKEDLIDFYNVACNFCVHHFKIKQKDYNQKMFDLFKIMDRKNLLVEDGGIRPLKLKNIVVAGTYSREFDEATHLLNKYIPYIKKEFQKSVEHCGLGVIAFYQSNFKKAFAHLIKVKPINLAFELTARMLLIKCYYEIDSEYDMRTIRIFNSNKSFIKGQKKLPKERKESYLICIKIIIKLYKLRHKEGKETITKVYDELMKHDIVETKQWLLEKIEELKTIPKNKLL